MRGRQEDHRHRHGLQPGRQPAALQRHRLRAERDARAVCRRASRAIGAARSSRAGPSCRRRRTPRALHARERARRRGGAAGHPDRASGGARSSWPRSTSASTTRSPTPARRACRKNKSEGDMPQLALTTGSADALECLLRKIGIDDSEFTDAAGTAGSTCTRRRRRQQARGGSGWQGPHAGQALLGHAATRLNKYDAVFLSCEGAQNFKGDPDTSDDGAFNKDATSTKKMQDYSAIGGARLRFALAQHLDRRRAGALADACQDAHGVPQACEQRGWLAQLPVGPLRRRLRASRSRQQHHGARHHHRYGHHGGHAARGVAGQRERVRHARQGQAARRATQHRERHRPRGAEHLPGHNQQRPAIGADLLLQHARRRDARPAVRQGSSSATSTSRRATPRS